MKGLRFMKAKKVLELLKITRQTLYQYAKNGLIPYTVKPSGQYDYNDDAIYKFISKKPRINVMYCRVSTKSQKSSLQIQNEQIQQFALNSGIVIDKKYEDIESGMTLDRPGLNDLFSEIFLYKIDTIYITNKDRLTRLSFKALEEICSKFGTKIVAISSLKEDPNDEKELLHDIISLVHTFSMKMYSNRRKNKLLLIENDLNLESEVKTE